ncbi:MAG: FeoB-associated Cys-rich membrane protein [Victivallaceae bacterium]|nr:FeoB-associated Cys-rich membrane protein [Victivallaceae bacterium]
MTNTEYIILAVIAVLALAFIIRTIVKIARGESSCLSCKGCGDDDQEKTKEMPAEQNSQKNKTED